METQTVIPVLAKSQVSRKKVSTSSNSCCTPKDEAEVCCTPSNKPEENAGACCAQPADGSACCNK